MRRKLSYTEFNSIRKKFERQSRMQTMLDRYAAADDYQPARCMGCGQAVSHIWRDLEGNRMKCRCTQTV